MLCQTCGSDEYLSIFNRMGNIIQYVRDNQIDGMSVADLLRDMMAMIEKI